MRDINSEIDNKNSLIKITDFPDAVKVIALEGVKTQALADIALCRSDLLEARRCLDLADAAEDNSDHQKIFWKMSVISFTKCFKKNNARATKLSIQEILENDVPGQETFTFFEALRDKNIAHDDSPVTQCCVGAVLNKDEAPRKIAQIITMNVLGSLYAADNSKNLRRLIDICLEFTQRKYDQLCDELTSELESQPYSDLLQRKQLNVKIATANEVNTNRQKLSK